MGQLGGKLFGECAWHNAPLAFLAWIGMSWTVGISACAQPIERTPKQGTVLPFPVEPSASIARPRIDDSIMEWPVAPRHTKSDAPNVLIVLIDDSGFGVPDTFGGEAHTPALSELWRTGIAYNAFHTTAICSPTRAALLTGRNHHRVGSGTIAERASAFEGYSGVIPQSAATVAEVLHHYGYKSSAFGKWHNTPANQTTEMGPFDRWPTGHGFDYFYGFIAGETSQWEPRLYRNTSPIEPPHRADYHLSEDLADEAIGWLKKHRAFTPDQPFLMYWAPGAVHGPHHVPSKWADKYKGRFDAGWDAYRERVFARQKEIGWIPPSTQLTPRPDTLESWDAIPESERAFQLRLMELYAGFVEHTDAQVGRVIDALEDLGVRENTIVFYIWGDNGSSAEGQRGTVSELLAQNNLPNTIEQQLAALAELGGIDVLGSSKVDNMYHAGWAWAGSTPFRSTKLVAAHFGGTRNPMVVSWPAKISPDRNPRSQFHHVNDIVPTLYELIGVTTPEKVNGFPQDPIDGISMAYTFSDADAKGRKQTQYFENNGSRGIFHDGWFACSFGPFIPWDTPGSQQRIKDWNPELDVWELYDLNNDFSQADDLAEREPQRLEDLKKLFLIEAEANKVFPIGGGMWTRYHPEDVIATTSRSWQFDESTRRMPEFTAPPLGKRSNRVTIELETPANASGVLYALGGASGGLALYLDEGHLIYDYNMLIIERTDARSAAPLSPGKHVVEVDTTIDRPGAPAAVVLRVDGQEVGRTTVKRTVPAAFTASETLDVGADLGSPVALQYFDRAPFAFEGPIRMRVELK
jgi:arylsulfatase